MAQPAEELLRALAANDEESVRMVLALRPEAKATDCPGRVADSSGQDVGPFGRAGRARCAHGDVALGGRAGRLAGADEREIVAVLAAVAPEIGLPRTVDAAPRLALAIGYELDVD